MIDSMDNDKRNGLLSKEKLMASENTTVGRVQLDQNMTFDRLPSANTGPFVSNNNNSRDSGISTEGSVRSSDSADDGLKKAFVSVPPSLKTPSIEEEEDSSAIEEDMNSTTGKEEEEGDEDEESSEGLTTPPEDKDEEDEKVFGATAKYSPPKRATKARTKAKLSEQVRLELRFIYVQIEVCRR